MADRAGGYKAPAVRHWLRFTAFAKQVSPIRGLGPHASLRAKLNEERLLMDFALWLVLCNPSGRRGGISVATAVKYISTVKAWHVRHFGVAIGAGLELSRLKDMLKGMKRELGQPPKRMRYGVRTQHLAEAMRRYLPAESTAPDVLNWRAALSTGFCGLLRAAEMALQRGETWDPELHLSRADVTFHRTSAGVRYAVVMMRPVKNGRTMRGKSVPLILMGGGSLLDPVEALWRLTTLDPVPEEQKASTPLFRLRTGARAASITVDQVCTQVKRLMALLGLDPARFGAHSLRIGGATAAAAAGVPPAVIRCCGRWNSDVFEVYTRLTQQTAARMTCVIGSTAFDDLERGEFHCEELEMLPSEMAAEPSFEDDDDFEPEEAL